MADQLASRPARLVLLFVLGLFLSPPGAAAPPPDHSVPLSDEQIRSLDLSDLEVPEGPVDVTHPELLERFVRLAYGRLGLMLRDSGYDLRFEIDELRHYYPEDFDEVLWLDIVDLPEGEVIDISRERLVKRTSDTATETFRYRAKWVLHEAHWQLSSDSSPAASLTLQDLQTQRQATPGFRLRAAVTAYRVTVHLDGKQRTYKANFGWTEPAGQETPVVVSDLIVRGVELGLTGEAVGTRNLPTPERLQVAPAGHALSTEGHARGDTVGTLAATSTGCKLEDPSIEWTLLFQKGTDDHATGVEAHVATAEAGIDCKCEPNCNATCESRIRFDRCFDDGGPFINFLTACHQPSPAAIDGEVVTQRDSASCTTGIACAFKACKITTMTVTATSSDGWERCGSPARRSSARPT